MIRVILFAAVVAIAALLAAHFWPADELAVLSTDLESIEITAEGQDPYIEEVTLSPAPDNGTNIYIRATFDEETGALHASTSVTGDATPDPSDFPCAVEVGSCSSDGNAYGDSSCRTIVMNGSDSKPQVCNYGSLEVDAERTDYQAAGGTSPNPPSSTYEAEFQIPAYGDLGYVVDTTAGYAAVAIPEITFQANKAVFTFPIGEDGLNGAFPDFDPVSDIQICVPERLANANWTHGWAPQSFVEDRTDDCFAGVWSYEKSEDAYTPTRVAFGNLPTQLNQDEHNTLFTGIFVGIGGAAFIALIMDAVRPWKRDRD